MTELEIALFEGKKIRREWDKKTGQWFFSVIDVIETLTDSANPRDYWFKMKIRVKNEDGAELSTFCRQLKMISNDGKKRLTDVASAEGLLRIIQSIPSPKAEPFKQWLAKVGYERLQEIQDPEKSLDRARQNWQKMGRPEKWIQQRMMGQETRNKLTDYWKDHGVKEGLEYATLTNIIHQEWAELSVSDHKKLKGLKSENLRDHMSEAELIFTALAELSTRQIAETDQAEGFTPNKDASKRGGGIAKNARVELESKTGRKVISGQNFLPDTDAVIPDLIGNPEMIRPIKEKKIKITQEIAEEIMGKDIEFLKIARTNVFCHTCYTLKNKPTSMKIEKYELNDLGDIILQGICENCGEKVARYIESGENPESLKVAKKYLIKKS